MIKDKEVKKIAVILLISAIFLPFLVNGIYGFVLEYVPGKMYTNESDVWISFIGGFLGAGVTLLGVYWQINETKKEAKLNKISDTYGAYVLLKKWVEELLGYLVSFKILVELNSNLNEVLGGLDEKTRNIEKEEILKTASKSMEHLFQKNYNEDLIYNFIQNSLPSEKINLIDKTYSLNILVLGFEKNCSSYYLQLKKEHSLEFIENHIKMTKELMEKISLDKREFERKYKEEIRA